MNRTMSTVFCMLIIVAFLCNAPSVTASTSSGENLIAVPGSSITLKLWEEQVESGDLATFYEIRKDGRLLRQTRASYVLGLRYSHFDPLEEVPVVESSLAADENTNLYIVQFLTQPLEEFQNDILRLGGNVRHYVAQFAYLVEMNQATYEKVAELPYVRWIGAYHPAYRLDEETLQNLKTLGVSTPAIRYNIQVLDVPQKAIVVNRLRAMGAVVDNYDAGKKLVEATLNGEQLLQVARFDEVNFIDVWGPYESDMDIVREIGGANYLETMTGFSGEDVRGEIFDGGCLFEHQEFQVNPIIEHGPHSVNSHGTACMGVNFATGVNPQARGLLPDGQGIFADYTNWGLSGYNRYICAQQLVEDERYQAVFQTASVGPPQTSQYTTISAEADEITFDFNLICCQSQSNMGNQNSRPQAWAKNYVSGGGLYHYNTLDRSDDMWNYGASIGPASDGRIGVTFTHFYDQVFTTYSTSPTGYGQFSGTSNATPCIAGHFGLFFQMWDAGIFGNDYNPDWSVFQNRPHSTTAKAMMISSAYQYPFTGLYHDKTRTHQGWGMPDVANLYDYRNNYYIRDEADVLLPFETDVHEVEVGEGMPELKVVMVYLDPPGNPAVQTQHRINDLTLKVTSPSNVMYYGNNGLYEGVWSVPEVDSPDTKNTEEAVFVQNPEAGLWTIEVEAVEIIADSHVETPEMDADYALVVKGVGTLTPPDVTITLEPINPPITIPAVGGSFDFNVTLTNNEMGTANFDAWIIATMPLGGEILALGPVNLTRPGNSSVTRQRTQYVPGGAPNGTYIYTGNVGYYPSVIASSSFFNFEKSETGDGAIIDEWLNAGEPFDEQLAAESSEASPTLYSLAGNYPNPFNPTTTLSFTLPEAGKINLAVYDVRGRLIAKVVDGYRQAGSHQVTFDATGLPSGIYFAKLETAGYSAVQKMVLMK